MTYSTFTHPNLSAEIIDRESCADFHRAYAEFLDTLNDGGISAADNAARNNLISCVLDCIAAAEENAFNRVRLFQAANDGDKDVEAVPLNSKEPSAALGEIDFFDINDNFEGKSLVSAFSDSEDTPLCRDGLELHFSSTPGGEAECGLHVEPVLDQHGQPKLLCSLCPYDSIEADDTPADTVSHPTALERRELYKTKLPQ